MGCMVVTSSLPQAFPPYSLRESQNTREAASEEVSYTALLRAP